MVVQLVVVLEVPFLLVANICWSVLLCLYVTVGGGHRPPPPGGGVRVGWVGGWVVG